MFDYSKEFEAIANAYAQSGGDATALLDKKFASLVVSGNKVLASNSIPGVRIESEETKTGVRARVIVEPGTQVAFPVHLCFGVIPQEGLQEISSDFEIGEGAKINFLAHCSFPNALQVRHLMEATIHIGPGAELTYSEIHFHGPKGGTVVIPRTVAKVEAGATFNSQFKLVTGSVGILDLDLKAELEERAICDLETKVYGKGEDKIKVKESIYLNGPWSRGLVKSRIVVSERAQSEVLGEAIGNGPHTRGHVDCLEIIQGNEAQARAVPLLKVVNATAKLTHEAAIGSVDKKQVQTLMARGLTESEAVETVVRGLLK